jgi:hypothetical protein
MTARPPTTCTPPCPFPLHPTLYVAYRLQCRIDIMHLSSIPHPTTYNIIVFFSLVPFLSAASCAFTPHPNGAPSATASPLPSRPCLTVSYCVLVSVSKVLFSTRNTKSLLSFWVYEYEAQHPGHEDVFPGATGYSSGANGIEEPIRRGASSERISVLITLDARSLAKVHSHW